MSLTKLDYLSSKEGGNAFCVLYTAAMATANKVEVENPEQLDDLIAEVIADNSDLYGGDEEKSKLLFDAIDDVLYTSVVAQHALNTAMENVIQDEAFLIRVTAGLLQAAAQVNVVNAHSPNEKVRDGVINKRNFIRLAGLMYEIMTITNRNLRMINGDSPGKFQ